MHDEDDFRGHVDGAVDWVAGYLRGVAALPVAAQVEPGEIFARVPLAAPEAGEPLDRILRDLTQDLLPGITHWNHPRFLAYVPQSATPPAIAADLIVSALNVNGLLWQTSPALAELEQAVLGWLARLLALPASWFGQIQESASLAALTALAVARECARPWVAGNGRVVCSQEAHVSVHKAAHVLDMRLSVIAVDADGRIALEALARELARGDVAAVVATVGTTSTAATDPLRAVGALCRAHGAWLHVDGAYGSAAAICPEYAHLLDGVEQADSFVVNAHKWLGLTAACSCLYTPRRDALRATFATAPSYLQKDDTLLNLVDYGPLFSRRLSSLKLWFTMRATGAERMREAIRHAIALAAELASWVEADPAWELCAHNLAVVCLRLRAGDAINDALVQAVNRDGRIFISGTRIGGRSVLRLAIGNRRTRAEDVALAWTVLREHVHVLGVVPNAEAASA
jgi:aromatic-L-amino-acid decarboxylase